MLWEFPIWFFLWALSTGLGLLAAWLLGRVGGRPFQGPLDGARVFWLGLSVLIGLLQLHSLALPCNTSAWVWTVPIAAVGWVLSAGAVRSRLRARLTTSALSRRLVEAVVAVLMLFVVANQAIQPLTWWDTQTLHLSQAKWIHEFRAPPGLANLYPKLGFDSAEDLLAAFVEIGPWRRRSVHVLNGFLMAALLLTWLRGITRPATTTRAWCSRAFRIVTAGYVIEKLCSNEVPSLSTDLSMAIFALVVFADVFRLSPRSGNQVATLLGIAAACVAFKLSGLFVFVCVIPLAVAFVLRVPHAQRLRSALVLVALPALLLLGLELRRIVLTGWLFYPAPSGNLHLSWSVPRAIVVYQYQLIKSWARVPRADAAEVLSRPFLGWFVPWFEGFRRTREFQWLTFGSLALLARTTSSTVRRIVRRASLTEICAVAGAAGAIAYWFLVAPDVRFGGVFFWIYLGAAAALPLALAARSGLAGAGVLAVVGALSINLASLSINAQSTMTKLAPEAPVFPTQKKVVDATSTPPSVVYVPDQWEFCGNAELPCASVHPELVHWRRPGHLESGFRP